MAIGVHDRHIPLGRTLHLVDIENLCGGPYASFERLRRTVEAYQRALAVRLGDHVVMACNRGLLLDAGRAWPGVRLCAGNGPDGADLALLDAATTEYIGSHYDRVVIGSGDGIFAPRAYELRLDGLVVAVVSLRRSLSPRLAAVAHLVRELVVDPELRPRNLDRGSHCACALSVGCDTIEHTFASP